MTQQDAKKPLAPKAQAPHPARRWAAHRVPTLRTLPRWPESTTFRARARQLPSWSRGRGFIWAMLVRSPANGGQAIRPHCCAAALGFHVKAKG